MPTNANNDRRINTNTRQGYSSWFALPPPLKRLFDHFPLVTYSANNFPASATRDVTRHLLYIFTTDEGVRSGAPSFNPSCLKWQTYLKIVGIDFDCVASNNHASPSGSLPFLVTATGRQSSSTAAASSSSAAGPSQTISSKGFRKWMPSQKPNAAALKESSDTRYETYQSLIDGRLRVAWLFQLYVCPENRDVVQRLYLANASSNTLVQAAIAHQLRQAAEAELRRSSFLRRKTESELWHETGDAFFALSMLLGDDSWFFGGEEAGYFDASVFAYTHLILDESAMSWRFNHLKELLEKQQNLVLHRDRLLKLLYQ